jgi:signal transduction histidine kinase
LRNLEHKLSFAKITRVLFMSHLAIIRFQPRSWLSALLVLILTLALFPAQAADVLTFDKAEFVVQSGEMPHDDAPWVSISLPDQWKHSRPGYGGDVWYRLRFSLNEVPRTEQAVYLPHLCMNAAIYLNGVFLGDGGSFSDPVGRNWNRPLIFLAPPALLKVGENTLIIRVHSPAYSLGSLSPVQIGAHRELRPLYEKQFFWHITLNQTATLIIAAMGLFMLALWWRRRQDTMYGFFGLSSIVWAFNSSNLFLRDIPIPAPLWESLINASFQVFISLLMISLLRFIGLRQRLLERTLWAILIGSPVSLLLLPASTLIPVSMMWHLLTLLSSLAVCVYLVRETLRKPHMDSLLLIGALGLNLVFGIHDWLKQAAISNSGDTHWIHYGGPVFFLVVGGIMTNRFVQALNQYEQLNADLEQRVDAKHTELETQYATLREVEKQRATMEERDRIYRDLHDDVGAKLLGLAISAQRANLPREADLARSALQDLRDVVSRSTQDNTPLDDLLADWRAETEQRVQAAGLVLEWQFPEESAGINVSPQAALNLSRILRETVTNVLRHAGASHIRVVTEVGESEFRFSVEDDGVGFDAEKIKPHRGMSGMQARAAALGATLIWQTVHPHGCRAKFCAPLAALTPP